MTVILFLLISFSVFAQEQFEYRIEGSFNSEANLDSPPAVVNYSIHWNETPTTIQGIYRDNYFTQGSPRPISGEISEDGRRFSVFLPDPVFGVESIILTTPRRIPVTGGIPMTIVTQDAIGGVIKTESTTALMSILPGAVGDATPDEDACTIGFGVLTGYCGMYGGRFTETVDSANRCDLARGNTLLELSFDTVYRLYLNYIPGVPNQPMHVIGAFAPSPVSNSVNITGRNCGPMDGTTFPVDNCKVMNLSGIFFERAPTIQFTGTYSVTDQVTGETCSYTMLLNRNISL